MKAICNEWKTWYGETLEVEVDVDMLMEIIDRIDTAIDVAVSEKDYELAAELIDNRIDLPVIVYSNVVQKEVIMQTLRLGASSYLVKPQPAEVIVQKALEVINAKRRA